MGFPVLTVTETPTGIKVRQDQFLEGGPVNPGDNETIWSVPLGLVMAAAPGQVLIDNGALLETCKAEFVLDMSKPFKINADTNGVYHVLYTLTRLTAIASEAAESDSIFSLSDRIRVVHDSFALGKAGYLQLSATFNLVHELLLVWDSIYANLDGIMYTWWERENVAEQLKIFRWVHQHLLGDQLYSVTQISLPTQALILEGRTAADTTQLRTLAVAGAAAAGDPGTTKVQLDRFAKYIAGDTSAIPVDLLNNTFSTVAAIRGLTGSIDPALHARTFDMILSSVRNQDLIHFFRFCANTEALYALREFFVANYSSINKRLETTFSMKYIVQSVYSGFGKEEDRVKAEAFFEDKDTRKCNQALAQALDGISAKAAFIEGGTKQMMRSVPLGSVTTAAPGQALVDNGALLETCGAEFALDTSKPFKVNADTNGVYHVLYTPTHLAAIASEAVKPDSIFSLGDRIGLVNEAIDANLDGITHTWWESEKVAEQLKVFRRALCSPLVEKLGLEYSKDDSTDITQLRTLAVSGAATAGDARTIKVLPDCFTRYIAGNTSAVPVNLLNAAFSTAVKHAGVPAYNAMLKLFENPKTASIEVAAMHLWSDEPNRRDFASAHVQLDPAEGGESEPSSTFSAASLRTRRRSMPCINKRLETTFLMKYVIQSVYGKEDQVTAEAFFKDKDTRMYNQALAQALDGERHSSR
ncbi:hypothetical protein EDB87DRAFT_1681291 [Lactarius vividus]|nr:hypothetical protein EDB87DRAFT_1681291 [Lactarius vividus]